MQNHFGYEILKNTNKQTLTQKDNAALTKLLAYLPKKGWKKQCLIIKKYCTIPFWLMTFETIVSSTSIYGQANSVLDFSVTLLSSIKRCFRFANYHTKHMVFIA